MNCPNCQTDFKPTKKALAQELGRHAAGKKKKFSDEELQKRRERLAKVRHNSTPTKKARG